MSADLPGRLPHRAPFHFISTAAVQADGSVTASWCVDGTEEFLRGHFPGRPLVPGVLIAEALAQCAGLVLAAGPDAGREPNSVPGAPDVSANSSGALAQIELRFRRAVTPPAVIALRATRTGGLGDLHQFDVTASVEGAIAAQGTLVLAVPAGNPGPAGPAAL